MSAQFDFLANAASMGSNLIGTFLGNVHPAISVGSRILPELISTTYMVGNYAEVMNKRDPNEKQYFCVSPFDA